MKHLGFDSSEFGTRSSHAFTALPYFHVLIVGKQETDNTFR
jgi:hypothetical protein